MRKVLVTLVLGLFAAVGCGDDDKPVDTEVLAKACDEGSTKHPSGTTWTCSDGCNRCSCDNGKVEQTGVSCTDTGDPFQVDSNVPTDTSEPDTADAADGG